MTSNNVYDIPIYVISYNRCDTLRKCIDRYAKDGYTNIHIVDNASTNKELLDYLHDSPFEVHFLKKNYGHMVIWSSGEFDDVIEHQYYVVTDPDILPSEDCPSDYLQRFYDELLRHPEVTKVGFSLRIDDLPDEYPYKYDIIRYESFYWQNPIFEPNGEKWYDALLDTTFAIYRPGKISLKTFYKGIRSAAPYTARHLGWYMDFSNLNKEESTYAKMGGNILRRSVLSICEILIYKAYTVLSSRKI